ncbi:cellulase family glycosylhydrolase [Bacillus sp. JCM 19041]|uniref:glycoside hydrolase family 5 protein n=1 Tax=Bacillus sp. JCM 19041 TaxID=1460637 RepID=UPI0006D00469
MKIRSLFTMVGVLLLLVVPVKAETGAISPQSVVENMGAGWNLGNTLDAIPTEGSWNNPPVREETFDDIKEAGFESVRIPVTWTDHMGPAPNYVVEDAWMDRVEQVVDWAMDRDFYVVLNVHHDSWQWLI